MVRFLFAVTQVFAHESGFSWDEALMVMAPIAAVAAVLFLVNNRARKLFRDEDASHEPGREPRPGPAPAEADGDRTE